MSDKKLLAFTGLKPHKMPFGFDEDSPACISLKEMIKKSLIELIENENVTRFISSVSMGIEMICAEIVLELKREYPYLELEAAVTHKEQSLLWPDKYRERYDAILEQCVYINLSSDEYMEGLIEKRNKYMINKCDLILAIWNEKSGVIGDFMSYALKRKKQIIIIDPYEFAATK